MLAIVGNSSREDAKEAMFFEGHMGHVVIHGSSLHYLMDTTQLFLEGDEKFSC